MLERIFILKRWDIIGGWEKKLHNEKLYVLYFSSDIIRVIKLRWTRLIAHLGNMKNAYEFFVRKSEERDVCQGLGLFERITLKWVAEGCGVIVCTGLVGFRVVTSDVLW